MKTKYLVAGVLFLLILVNIGTIWNFGEIALGNYYISQGEYEKAIDWFSQRHDNLSKLNLGNTYYKQGKFQKALTSYEALIKSKADKDVLFASLANAGNANYYIGKNEENPTSKKVERKKALAHYLEALKIKKDAKVEKNYQKVLALLDKLDTKESPQPEKDQTKPNQNGNSKQDSQDEQNQSSEQSGTGQESQSSSGQSGTEQQNQSSSKNNDENGANGNTSQENSSHATASGSENDAKKTSPSSQAQDNQTSSSAQSSSGNLLQQDASGSLSPKSNSGAISKENTSQSLSGSTATGSGNFKKGNTLKPDTSGENQLSPSQLDALEEYQKGLMEGQKDTQDGFNKVYQDPNHNQIFQMFGNPFFDNSLLRPNSNEKNW